MDLAMIGKCKYNEILDNEFKENNISLCILEDLNSIKKIYGEIGEFTIDTDNERIQTQGIVIAEQLLTSDSILEKYPFINLADIDSIGSVGDYEFPVVFVMDYPYESSVHDNFNALNKALRLARKKKNVLLFSRFMRTGAKDLENIYMEARNTGVTFIKYDLFDIDYCEQQDIFKITADDGYGNITVETKTVVTTQNTHIKEELKRILKLLRIKTDKDYIVNTDKHFLFPTLTSRKGVYYLNESLIGSREDLISHVRFTASDIKKELDCLVEGDMRDLAEQRIHAEVEPAKCAFCYTCYRACTHAAMVPDHDNSVMKNLIDSCFGCGICVSVCPANAIRLVEHKTDREIEKSGINGNALKVFCCENSGEIAVRRALKDYGEEFDKIELQPVHCGGEISVEIIIEALKEFEKVLVITCIDGACKHFEGNKRAGRFVERAREMLKASGFDESRIEYKQLSHAMKDEAKEIINSVFAEK